MARAYAPSRILADEVHKARQENVWIHDALAVTDYSMATSFAVPAKQRAVRFAELMEVQRQMAMLHLHRQAGVPLDAVFIVDLFSLRLLSKTQVPREGTIHSQLVSSDDTRGRRFVQRLALEGPGGLVAVGKSHARALPRKLYERLRTPPSQDTVCETAVSSDADERMLTVNSDDPLHSDHESDHITAVQIITAIEGAVTVSADRTLVALSIGFERYTEFTPVPRLLVEERANNRFGGTVDQGGASTAVFSGRTSLVPSAEAGVSYG